jgi:hypothetical protein
MSVSVEYSSNRGIKPLNYLVEILALIVECIRGLQIGGQQLLY